MSFKTDTLSQIRDSERRIERWHSKANEIVRVKTPFDYELEMLQLLVLWINRESNWLKTARSTFVEVPDRF